MGMKKAMKKKSAMKSMKKKSSKKGGMKKKAMRVSKIAKGKRAKSSVFRGSKVSTSGGLKKSDLTRNKDGKVVSKKASAAGKKLYKQNGLDKWISSYWWKIFKGTGSSQEGSFSLQEIDKKTSS